MMINLGYCVLFMVHLVLIYLRHTQHYSFNRNYTRDSRFKVDR
jgi:hypothetical protein